MRKRLIAGILLMALTPLTAIAKGKIYSERALAIVVSKNEPYFSIKLKSNPSTGYQWVMQPKQVSWLTLIGHQLQKSNPLLVGSPGFERWDFKVSRTGFMQPQQITLRFKYIRPWEKATDTSPIIFNVNTATLANH